MALYDVENAPLFGDTDINSPFMDSLAGLFEHDRLDAVQEHLQSLVSDPQIGVEGIMRAIETRRANLSNEASGRLRSAHRYQLMDREWLAADPNDSDDSYAIWLHTYHSTGAGDTKPGFRHVRDAHGHKYYVGGVILSKGYVMDTWDEPSGELTVPRPDLDAAFNDSDKDKIETIFRASDEFIGQFEPHLDQPHPPGTVWGAAEGAHRLKEIELGTQSLVVVLKGFRGSSPIYSDPDRDGTITTQHIIGHTPGVNRGHRISRH